jgi:hypothetical protein
MTVGGWVGGWGVDVPMETEKKKLDFQNFDLFFIETD